MIKILKEKSAKLEWVNGYPAGNNETALLIPFYNESSNCDFTRRLFYYEEVARKYKDKMDVILIDDGSTDDSLEKIRSFVTDNYSEFIVVSVTPNTNKVGALFLTVLSIPHDLIVLSDFDTDIINLENLLAASQTIYHEKDLMGCYFRMLPYEGDGAIFRFQQFEYSLVRSLYEFHKKDGSVPVMPGAGSCYKRDVLVSIYREHSGFRSGEDREATLLGLKMGYRTVYKENVLTLTRPPLSFKTLVKQRIRWNLGYLETFYKEKKYYYRQISQLTRVGIRTVYDMFLFSFVVTLPLLLIVAGIIHIWLLAGFMVFIYAFCLLWCLYVLIFFRKETGDMKGRSIKTVLAYPAMKIAVDYFAWTGALFRFLRKKQDKI
ncbi:MULTISPECIES: glycosyltransferase [Niastella]|uniref:Glycosyltransferase family 2 protein n=1 Tax=Niastella soli TaxID=2821487 RepID=A0ABS3YVK0_9BACT|nr:glycosyltransferase family 2 protein [Niastella soli]MBO9201552.1 glycosyltransferase family 2 protein [Niastella soli]